ncbi:MAG: carbamoyltransferase C-terminal domain-containing protein [Syntrophobacteraceae bacterium]|nr:carbamoyltransferase C-terminal domain-containing protein [Syntrophobacteraceae bacterium]
MSIILGINAFHPDSAACLVIDGVLQSAIAEERLGSRLKHSPHFPENAIRRVLGDAGVRLKDVTHVAFARDTKANLPAKAAYVSRHPLKSARAVLEHVRRNSKTRDIIHELARICDADPSEARFEQCNVEHHLAHIASAYYLSPFDSVTAGFSYDGSGDFATMMAARCEGNEIKILGRVYLPHSMGAFYTALCQVIGFDVFGEEYKVMGLAPYGEDSYADEMRDLVRIEEKGWFRLNAPYFEMHDGSASGVFDEDGRILMGRLFSARLAQRLGGVRKRSEPLGKREKDIARSCQARFEDIAIHCMNRLHDITGTDNLAMAGGCALNGVTNARILRDTPFTKQYLQCASSDDGTCIGAAYYCWHSVLGQKKRFHMTHAYWGPEYTTEHLRKVAEGCGCPVRHCEDEQSLLRSVVGYLVQGLVVGWYQGRSEWGPRALGNRSILANPTLPNMRDTINAKIKRRESFRPFAPTVLRELVGTYFEQDIESPFMMHVVKIRPEWREKLPAITHVDGTGRLQSMSRNDNPRYYDLIELFRRETGVGVLLNTSFNENEPIVDTPEQAMACFLRTDMDVLCLGDFVIVKPDAKIDGDGR